ncbi:MAG: ribosome maturation factor RimM, partial [Bacilli bacterium]
KIINTHGIRGEVKVMSHTDFEEERFQAGNTLYVIPNRGDAIAVEIATVRMHKGFYLMTFKGLNNINDVEKWKGLMLQVPETALGELPEGEYYYHQIVGCEVFTDEGTLLGTVKEVLSPGANDVWVVQGERKKEYYIPYIDSVVNMVDVAEKKIIITPLEGLLDL